MDTQGKLQVCIFGEEKAIEIQENTANKSKLIAAVFHGKREGRITYEEAEKYAVLFAAAPNLLEVLSDILFKNLRTEDLEKLDGTHEIGLFIDEPTLKKARAAIAKAERK